MPPSLPKGTHTAGRVVYYTQPHRQHSYTHREACTQHSYTHTERDTQTAHTATRVQHTQLHTQRDTQHSYTLTVLHYYFITVYTVVVYSSRGGGPRRQGAGLASQPRRKETERHTTHRDRETHNTQRHTTHMHKQTQTQYIHTCIVGRGVPCPLPSPSPPALGGRVVGSTMYYTKYKTGG